MVSVYTHTSTPSLGILSLGDKLSNTLSPPVSISVPKGVGVTFQVVLNRCVLHLGFRDVRVTFPVTLYLDSTSSPLTSLVTQDWKQDVSSLFQQRGILSNGGRSRVRPTFGCKHWGHGQILLPLNLIPFFIVLNPLLIFILVNHYLTNPLPQSPHPPLSPLT